MLNRSELALKILCACILALLAYQISRLALRGDPLASIRIPAVPSLSPSHADAKPAEEKKAKTENTQPATTSKPGTNLVAATTNQVAQATNKLEPGTNLALRATNMVGSAANLAAQSTNTDAKATNLVSQGTNAAAQGTNIVAHTNAVASQPQNPAIPGPPGPGPGSGRNRPGGMRGTPGMPGMPGQGPELPPEVKTRVDRIVDSEILAPVMHPMPMALLGIVGQDIILRAPDGQTGLVKEGGELGGIKVIRIALNRVLIEQGGEKKELTIFEGLGSESLLSKPTDHHP